MSRSGYSDDITDWSLIRWRGQVASAIRGRRGQEFLRDLIAALDVMPEKKLIEGELVEEGEVCALGCLGLFRGIDVKAIDPYDHDALGAAFDIARPLAAEVMFKNDDGVWFDATPERRWQYMRNWAERNLR